MTMRQTLVYVLFVVAITMLATRDLPPRAHAAPANFGFTGIDSVSSFTTTSSNGTSPVTLVAATAGKAVFPTTMIVVNTHASTTFTVTILTSGGQELFPPFPLAPSEKFTLDGRGDVSTANGDALQMKLDQAGTAVKAGGFFVKKAVN